MTTYAYGADERMFTAIPVAVQTGAYSAPVNTFVPCDSTAGVFTVTLPAAPQDRAVVGVKLVAGTNTVTIACSGSDTLNTVGGSTTTTLTALSQGLILQYDEALAVWYGLMNSGGSSGGSGVTSFNTRTGAVVPASGDYSFSEISGTATIAQGGTGQATQQAALDALAGATTSGLVLRGGGSHVTLAAIQVSDVPTLNQNTSGTAAGLSSTLAIASGGTGQTGAVAAFNALSPTTTLGDTLSNDGTNDTRIAGNTTATKKFFTQTGTGSVSAAPGWNTIVAGDVPTLNQSTTGSSASCTGNAATATNLAGGATFPAYTAPKVVSLTDASTVAINAALGNDLRLTMTSGVGSTRALGAPSNPVDGQRIDIMVTQDSSGSRLLTYNAAFEFSTGLPSPTLSTGANLTDILGFIYNAAKSKWFFVAFLNGFS